MQYGICFKPSQNGASFILDDHRYKFVTEGMAETIAEHLNGVNNPAWRGTFEAVELTK